MCKHPRFAILFFVAASACGVLALPAKAQTYKADDIVKHFQPAPASPQAPSATRGLCIGTEAECSKAGHAVPPSKPPAAFDLVVKFKYNSDVLEPEARLNLDEFAKALKAPQLVGSSFAVEGHTDAAGGAAYNQSLSERRAQSVVRYLGEKGIDTSRLAAKGYGQSRPIAADPLSGDNRRVETRLRAE